MNDVKFKVGDRVYCPHLTSNILRCVCSENSPNLLAIEYHNKLIDITTDGKFWNKQGLVNDVFPATQQWYEHLSILYPNVSFEPPPKIEIMNKKQAIEKYRDTPLNFISYHKNTFYFQSESEKMCVVCSPCYVYDFEISDKETISTLLEYLDNDEIDISIDGEFLE